MLIAEASIPRSPLALTEALPLVCWGVKHREEQPLSLESGCSSVLRVGVGDGLYPGIYYSRREVIVEVRGGSSITSSQLLVAVSFASMTQMSSSPLPPLAVSWPSPSSVLISSLPAFPF